MSGDVQPRKRKDKKKRKDELGIEEPRGTSAALGEGDVFMHSQHEHGTGGHWCAKIIFFSLLAVLITLIGLIILENRGLTELEANSVETKYSGVLEGWIEEPSEDDHYDAHTLDLNHPEEDEHHDTEANFDHEDDDHEDEDHDEEGHEDEDHDEEDDDDEDQENYEHEDEDHEDETDKVDDNEDSEENLEEADEESEEKNTYRRYVYDEQEEDDDEDDKSIEAEDKDDNEDEDDDDQDDDESDQGFDTGNDPEADSDEDQDDNDKSNEYVEEASNEYNTEEDNLEEDDDDQDGEEDDIEKIEAERPDWESYEEDEKASSINDDVSNEIRSERSLKDSKEISKDYDDDEREGIQETEDDDEPPVERITTPPAGKPFVEIEEETIPKPIDTLAEEAEYEKKQEELRRQKEEEAQASQKDGGNSIEDQWPGEPSDPYWREQLDFAEEELRQGSWALCEQLLSAPQLSDSGRARWILAKALDAKAEAKRDNVLLSKAISAYLNLLKMNERISDKKLVEVAQRTIDRIQFRGTYLNAEPIYRLLIRRFPNDVNYRNNLTVAFLMANRAELAEEVLQETLQLWPHDRIALAHHGFVLKNQHNKLEEAVVALQKALEEDSGPANEARFYYHLGDALLSLGRFNEAHEVHKRGTKLGHFLSPSQRSLYNVPRLKSRPWWSVEHTPYVKLARALESSWSEILNEGELAKASYEKEKEGLKERGEWSQLDIFVRGREIPGRCKTAPVTCSIVRSEVAAAGCRRGQIKFSAIEPGTHIRPHVGPTNCRLRMHLGLKNTKDTYIRVDKETRQWQVGKTFIFDDSFEHEVWHNGTGSRLVLIVDLWHPQLTPQERKQLPAI